MFFCWTDGRFVASETATRGVNCKELQRWTEIVSAVFVLATCFFTFRHIRQHLKYSSQPELRKYTIREDAYIGKLGCDRITSLF